jgi:uncharacterized protein (TIGR02996 family)
MNTEAALLQSIEANLADPTPILVLADWLEEQGNERLAHAWRWMARRGYRPGKRVRRLARIPWGWWHGISHEMEADAEDLIDIHSHPEACLPTLHSRAMDSKGPPRLAGLVLSCAEAGWGCGDRTDNLVFRFEYTAMVVLPGAWTKCPASRPRL